MTARRIPGFVTVLCVAAALAGSAPSPQAADAGRAHVMVQAQDLKWVPAPPFFPPGQVMAILSGNPAEPGPVTLRAKLPAGYRIAPHWHPTDEHVTVLSGTFAMGIGDRVDESALHDLGPGGFALMPATVRHYAVARTETVLQIHGTGPLVINYVNPADDPRNAPAK